MEKIKEKLHQYHSSATAEQVVQDMVDLGAEIEDKPVLYVDMDGVVANFDAAIKSYLPDLETGDHVPDYEGRSKKVTKICMENPTIFHDLAPIKDSIGSVRLLVDYFDVYFLSTPIWDVPDSYTGKRLWVEKYFGEIGHKRLILTHRKDLVVGKYLIDDTTRHGVDAFKGEHIHFGTDRFPHWKSVVDYLLKDKKRYHCSECDFANYTSAVSQEDIDSGFLACVNCGCDEFVFKL